MSFFPLFPVPNKWSELAAVALPASASGPIPLYSQHKSSQCSSQWVEAGIFRIPGMMFRHEPKILVLVRRLKLLLSVALRPCCMERFWLWIRDCCSLRFRCRSWIGGWKHATSNTAICLRLWLQMGDKSLFQVDLTLLVFPFGIRCDFLPRIC